MTKPRWPQWDIHRDGCRHEVMLTNAAWPFISPGHPTTSPWSVQTFPPHNNYFRLACSSNLLPLLLPPHSQQVTEEQEALVKENVLNVQQSPTPIHLPSSPKNSVPASWPLYQLSSSPCTCSVFSTALALMTLLSAFEFLKSLMS